MLSHWTGVPLVLAAFTASLALGRQGLCGVRQPLHPSRTKSAAAVPPAPGPPHSAHLAPSTVQFPHAMSIGLPHRKAPKVSFARRFFQRRRHRLLCFERARCRERRANLSRNRAHCCANDAISASGAASQPKLPFAQKIVFKARQFLCVCQNGSAMTRVQFAVAAG